MHAKHSQVHASISYPQCSLSRKRSLTLRVGLSEVKRANNMKISLILASLLISVCSLLGGQGQRCVNLEKSYPNASRLSMGEGKLPTYVISSDLMPDAFVKEFIQMVDKSLIATPLIEAERDRLSENIENANYVRVLRDNSNIRFLIIQVDSNSKNYYVNMFPEVKIDVGDPLDATELGKYLSYFPSSGSKPPPARIVVSMNAQRNLVVDNTEFSVDQFLVLAKTIRNVTDNVRVTVKENNDTGVEEFMEISKICRQVQITNLGYSKY